MLHATLPTFNILLRSAAERLRERTVKRTRDRRETRRQVSDRETSAAMENDLHAWRFHEVLVPRDSSSGSHEGSSVGMLACCLSDRESLEREAL